jgi:high-affinity iron transporter
MLPSFVIGLREGVEAALIVGIIAGFLRQEGRRDALRPMWGGVVAAIVICAAVGGLLELLDEELPQRQQEGLETVIGVAAVGIMSFMIVWMRRHARGLSGQLRDSAREALASGSARALVAMAFFAVIREGLETVVFLLAVFQSADDPGAAGAGALLGLAVAVAIGALIYSGGVRLNLARFFRVTGFVLVLVAAGLVASTVHSAHEAGWLNAGQGQALDLTWLVVPGAWTSALLTGMLGWQPVSSGAAVLLLLVVLVVAGCGSGAATSAGGGRSVELKLTDAGCSPASLKLDAGRTTFKITNADTGRVSELEILEGARILAEKENLVAGVSGSFTLTLQPGRYTLSCPGGASAATGVLNVGG